VQERARIGTVHAIRNVSQTGRRAVLLSGSGLTLATREARNGEGEGDLVLCGNGLEELGL
jgi:hypothetical protein